MKKTFRLVAAGVFAAAAALAGKVVTEKVKEEIEETDDYVKLEDFVFDDDAVNEETEKAEQEEAAYEEEETTEEEEIAEVDTDIQDVPSDEEPEEEQETVEEEKEEPEDEPEPVEDVPSDNAFLGDWKWTRMMINDDIMSVDSVYGSVITHINEDGTVYNNDVKVGLWQLRENDLVVVADPEDEGEAMATVDGEHIAMCGFDEEENLIMIATMDTEDQVGKIMCERI